VNPHWLMRMALWARRPPGWRRVRFVLAIVALCLLLVALERVFGWPDALSPDRAPQRWIPF
jgi:hypothetical protein